MDKGLSWRAQISCRNQATSNFSFLAASKCERDAYRKARQNLAQSYCLVLKRRNPETREVVVIATEQKNCTLGESFDLLYADMSEQLTPEQEAQAKEVQEKLGLMTKLKTAFMGKMSEYPKSRPPAKQRSRTVESQRGGSLRNSLCPCKSGKKYKHCCMRR